MLLFRFSSTSGGAIRMKAGHGTATMHASISIKIAGTRAGGAMMIDGLLVVSLTISDPVFRWKLQTRTIEESSDV
jgi:hypothetical protein